MPDSPYKETQIPKSLKAESLGEALAASAPSPLMGGAWKSALRGADHVPAARRVIATQHTGGSSGWLVGNVPTVGASQKYPEATVKRATTVVKWQLAPGNVPSVRAVVIPCGMTEQYAAMTGWSAVTAQGSIEVDVRLANTSAVNDTKTAALVLPVSPEDDGYEGTTSGWSFDRLSFHTAVFDTFAAADFSESTTATATIKHIGGVRVVHCSVTERPATHRVADTLEDASIHGWDPTLPLPEKRPTIEARDGVTYDEHRFGTHRGLRTAARQNRQLGPMIAAWSSYAEGLAEVADTTQDPVSVSATSWVGLSTQGAISSWSTNNPGFAVPGHYAAPAPENLSTRLDGAVAIPVRCRVRARFTANGGDFGYVKFQTSARSWIVVNVPQVNTFAEYVATGWLEASAAPDDTLPVLQDFAQVDSGTMEVRDWSIEWGEFTVAE